MTPIIKVRDLEFSYAHHTPTLLGLNLEVETGSVVGLLGRNGAGKTTLLRAMMGLMRPSAGSVQLFGADPITNGVAVKQRVGYVSEDQVLPGSWTLRAVMEMHRNLFPTWDTKFVDELMMRFELPSNKRVRDMSKGQARQVALACAVAHRPELLILDEPGSGVDPVMRRELLETAIELLADSGSTILFSSHHVADVERLANRIVIMDKGEIALDAELDELKENHCVVSVPKSDEARGQLKAIPGCLSTRINHDRLSAVFSSSPGDLRGALANLTDASATHVSLEDLFIELVGGAA